MKKTEVNICDNCRRVVTEKKCEICDRDICEDCEDDMAVGLANGGLLFYVICCKKCSVMLEKSKMKQYFHEEPHRHIRKSIIGIFRNAIVVEKLQDRQEIEADRDWMMEKLKRDKNTTWVGGKHSPFKELPKLQKMNPWGNYKIKGK